MKLLYATSALYPSRLANRAQIYAMAEAFDAELGEDFALGIPAQAQLSAPFRLVRVPGSLRSFALARRYANIVARGGFSDIYCREERLLFFIRFFVRMRGLRARYHFEAHWMRSDLFFRSALKHANTVIAITNALADDLQAQGVSKERIVVAPDGVDLSRYESLSSREEVRVRYGIAADAFVAGYTGSFGAHHDWKGVDTILAAAAVRPGIFFWLVGGEPEEVARLRKEALPNVRFEGYADKRDIPAIQSACDVLILPNREGSAMAERHTSPLKLFEYMASGTPILASDLPSAREIVDEKSATFFAPGDASSLCAALDRIRAEPEVSRARAAAARVIAEHYTWQARASRILSAIRAV